MEETRSKEIWAVERGERQYPKRLENLPHMPKKLYVLGRLPKEELPTAAIVGARLCSPYGKEQAFRFGRYFSDRGVQVISGMAIGVDGEAHLGALDGETPTFGILGSGVDVCYPEKHRNLYRELQKRGGVISEFAPGTQPIGRYFPARNRIISALADFVLVIEAKRHSGSLITVDFALDQGKPVYALPGPVDSPLSQGCHQLIAEGAGIAFSPEFVLNEWDPTWLRQGRKTEKQKVVLARNEDMVYSCLDLQPKNLNYLVDRLKLSAREILESLCELQLQGLVQEVGKNYYIKNR